MGSLNYQYHSEFNVLEVKPHGVVRTGDILAYGREVLEEDLIKPGLIEVYDLAELENLVVDFRGARDLLGTLEIWRDRGWAGSIFYTPDPLHYGLIRMIGGLVEAVLGPDTVAFRPTREPVSLKDARVRIAT